jgi:dTMP kinase
VTREPPVGTVAPERDDERAARSTDGAAATAATAACAAPAARTRTNRIFGSPAFARLWGAQVVSSTGDWLGLVAITALADRVGGSYAGASIGLVLAARIVPGFFLAPLAGVVADRWNRRRLMVVCDLGRAAVMLTLPFVDSIAGLVLASLVLELFTLLWAPAKEAMVPNLVPRQSLTNANSLSMIASYATFPLGAALFTLSARLASLFDGVGLAHTLRLDKSGLAFVFDAVTFAISAALIWGLPIGGRRATDRRDAPPRRFDAGATLRDVREGWRFVVVDPVVRAVNCGLATGLIGGGMLIPLGALFARDVLSSGEAGYGVLVTALGIGVAFGVTGVSVLQRRVRKQWLFTTAVLSGGVALVLAASMAQLAPAAFAVGVLGLCAGTVYVVGFTLLHEHVTDDLRGRIFASLYTLIRLCLLLAMTTGPLLSELLDHASARWWHRHVHLLGVDVALPGVRLTLWLAGVIIMFAGWLAVVSLRAGEREPGPAARRTAPPHVASAER